MSPGFVREAAELLRRSVELCQTVGDRKVEAISVRYLGPTLENLGRLGQAQDHLQRFLELSRETSWGRLKTTYR